MSNQNRTFSGGSVDRNKPINFIFNGEKYQGFQGDTLASALLANDVHLIGRSFKYHRPRGILTAGSEEPNALIDKMGVSGYPTVVIVENDKKVQTFNGERTASKLHEFVKNHK